MKRFENEGRGRDAGGGGQTQRQDDEHGCTPQSRGSDVDHVSDTEGEKGYRPNCGLIQQEVGGNDQIKVKT